MSYKKAIEVLEALPEDQKVMVRNTYTDRFGKHCAIGHLVSVKPCQEGFGIRQLLEPRRVSSQIANINTKYIKDRLDELEMTEDEAGELQKYVDSQSKRAGPFYSRIKVGRPLFDAALNFMREQEGL